MRSNYHLYKCIVVYTTNGSGNTGVSHPGDVQRMIADEVWTFVINTRAEIYESIQEFQSGKYGG